MLSLDTDNGIIRKGVAPFGDSGSAFTRSYHPTWPVPVGPKPKSYAGGFVIRREGGGG